MLALWLLALLTAPTDCSRLGSPPEPISLEVAQGLTIDCIDYDIDGAIHDDAVARAQRLHVGDLFDAGVWKSDLQALLNLGFFRRLDTEVLRLDDRGVALRVHVQTAWSLLPFIYYEGGAVPTAILGAYYANLFGEMIDSGGYYMRRGPYNLGRAWLMVPHWPAPRALADLQVVFTGELRARYPGDAAAAAPDFGPRAYKWRVPASGVEVMRRGGFFDFGFQPVADRLTLSGRYTLLRETTVVVENLPAVVDADLRGQPEVELERGPKQEAWLSLLSATVLVGQVDLVDNFQFRGHELRTVVVGSSTALGSARDFAQLYVSYRGFVELLPELELAMRLTGAHSTSKNPNDHFVLGGYNLEPFVYNSKLPGLLTVRALRPGAFQGQELAFANLEPRFTVLHDVDAPIAGGISLQLAAFVDAGQAWTGDVPDRVAVIAGGGVLLTLLEFRYTYLNWYVARVLSPYPETVASLLLTRPFF